MADQEQSAPTMSDEEAVVYHTELRNELASLEMAEAFFSTKYKQERIARLKYRLGMTVD